MFTYAGLGSQRAGYVVGTAIAIGAAIDAGITAVKRAGRVVDKYKGVLPTFFAVFMAVVTVFAPDIASASFLPADIATTIDGMITELAADAITLLGAVLPLLFAVAGPFLALSLVKRFLYSAV